MFLIFLFTTLLFLLTILFFYKIYKIKKIFNLKSITKVVNYALIIQLIIGTILFFTIFYYNNDEQIDFTFYEYIFLKSFYYYFTIGTYIYLPLVFLLNLINFLQSKNLKKIN